MRKLLAAATAVALATASPALAHDGWNHRGGWNGGYYHHHYGNGWGWGAPFLGALAGTAIIASVLAAPYYGYGGYGYAPYYSYPTPLVPPQPRWCPGPYGPYQC
jgi:hypothetical protein